MSHKNRSNRKANRSDARRKEWACPKCGCMFDAGMVEDSLAAAEKHPSLYPLFGAPLHRCGGCHAFSVTRAGVLCLLGPAELLRLEVEDPEVVAGSDAMRALGVSGVLMGRRPDRKPGPNSGGQ